VVRIGPPPPRRRLPPWVVANTAGFWRAHLAAQAQAEAAGPMWPGSIEELLDPLEDDTPRDVLLARDVAWNAAFCISYILR
jgi:hypothetical protein